MQRGTLGRRNLELGATVKLADMHDNLQDPHDCDHDWTPVSFRFETQLLDDNGGVRIRQPDLEEAYIYFVCVRCAQWTYMTANWVGYFLGGSTTRGFGYKHNSSHAYSLDKGVTWRPEKPTCEELERINSDDS